MPQQFTNQDGELVLLSDQPFATPGGEGAIYEVVGQHNLELVAKIYHTKKIADSRQEKIEFMQQHNPTTNANENIKRAIIWVEEVLYRNGQFVGFIMKKVRDAITLKSLTLARNPSKNFGPKWSIFDHDQEGSHEKRLIIAYNLSQAVRVIHETGNYVLVDMKPENIFVRDDASIAIIDLDSIQIQSELKSFPAKVYTEEYAPPEKHQKLVDPKNGDILLEWDHFSLAVIIYELLFGIHPYQASHKKFTTRKELIEHNFYVHGNRARKLHTIPTVHKNFNRLDPALQILFDDAFTDQVYTHQKRPSPAEWSQTILPLFKLPKTAAFSLVETKPKKKRKKKATQPGGPSTEKIISEINDQGIYRTTNPTSTTVQSPHITTLDKSLRILSIIGFAGYGILGFSLFQFMNGGILNVFIGLFLVFVYGKIVQKDVPTRDFKDLFISSFLMLGAFFILVIISTVGTMIFAMNVDLLRDMLTVPNGRYIFIGLVLLGCLFAAKKFQIKYYRRFVN